MLVSAMSPPTNMTTVFNTPAGCRYPFSHPCSWARHLLQFYYHCAIKTRFDLIQFSRGRFTRIMFGLIPRSSSTFSVSAHTDAAIEFNSGSGLQLSVHTERIRFTRNTKCEPNRCVTVGIEESERRVSGRSRCNAAGPVRVG